MGKAIKAIGADAVVKVLSEAIDETVKHYQSKSGKKVDATLIAVLKEFVKLHGALLVDVALGKVGKETAIAAFMRVADGAGLADQSGWVECGVALFEMGLTGYQWTSATIKVSRAASLAAATGVGVPVATATTVTVALFGVLMTTKDAIDAANKCNHAISRKAEAEKRPAAVIGGRGYNLGQLSTRLLVNPSFGPDMVCRR